MGEILALLSQQLVYGLTLGSVYALIAIGYTMVYGILGMINFAHGEVYMVGAFLAWGVFQYALATQAVPIAIVPLVPLMLVVAMLGAGVLGVGIERFAYRPLRGAGRLAPLISAIGVSIFLQNLMILFQIFFLRGVRARYFETKRLFPPDWTLTLGPVRVTYLALLIVIASVLLMIGLTLFVKRTKLGKAMRATAQDREMAAVMGVSVHRTVSATFFIGSALGGAAGVLVGLYYTQIDHFMGYSAGIKAFTAAVLGGIGNIKGAMLGGVLLGVAESLAITYFNPAYKDLIAFLILILILVFRPSGIMGEDVSAAAEKPAERRASARGRRWWIDQAVPPRVVRAGLLLATLVIPFVTGEYWTRIAGLVALYVALAIGLNIVVGFAGLLDLGYVAFFGFGSYLYALLASPQLGLHVPFWIALLPVTVATAGYGMLVGWPTLRMRGDYLAIVTLAFGEITYILMVNLDRPINLTNGINGILSVDAPRLFGHQLGQPLELGALTLTGTAQHYYLLVAAVLFVVVLAHRLSESRVGRAWAAIREDETAAATMGIDLVRSKLLAYALGAATAGLGGVISAAWSSSVFPDSFLLTESILILCMVVLGGMGSIAGVMSGAAVLVVLPELAREFQQYRMLVFGLALVLMMVYRPQGLLARQ